MTKKHRANFRATEWQPEVARLRSLHGIHAQAPCFICRPRKNFDI
jgi:hypothetical protein